MTDLEQRLRDAPPAPLDRDRLSATLARRAYRRPVTDPADLAAVLAWYGSGVQPRLEQIAEVGIDGDVGFERDRRCAGVLDRPLVGDRGVDPDPSFDAQPTERIPQQCAVGKDLGRKQAKSARARLHLVRRNVTRVPGVDPCPTP